MPWKACAVFPEFVVPGPPSECTQGPSGNGKWNKWRGPHLHGERAFYAAKAVAGRTALATVHDKDDEPSKDQKGPLRSKHNAARRAPPAPQAKPAHRASPHQRSGAASSHQFRGKPNAERRGIAHTAHSPLRQAPRAAAPLRRRQESSPAWARTQGLVATAKAAAIEPDGHRPDARHPNWVAKLTKPSAMFPSTRSARN
jgi:hypothetical protein